jgi:hypothetical protein
MSAVADFRPFKVPQAQGSDFLGEPTRANEEFAVEDLARSGLVMSDMLAHAPPMLKLREGAKAGYIIPYFDPQGRPLVDENGYLAMYRVRYKYPDFHKGNRYDQPSGEQLIAQGLPPYVPYIHPRTLTLEGDTLVCAEGEKKAASILKYLGLPVFGIGGCQMWRDPSGSGDLHPWIRLLCEARGIRSLIIVPDGDLFRYDICGAYGTFARAAENFGLSVSILNPGDKIDDALVRWGPSAAEHWSGIPRISANDLVQSPASLVKKYALAFKVDSKERVVVHQHTANIIRLMEEHPAFPKVWRNLDTNRVMVGEKTAQPDLTEMEIANYLQYYLGLDKVTHRTVFSCIQALSKKNARSPMLDWVRSLKWDGKSRLDSWLIRLWGVKDETFSREICVKWLVGACARLDKPGTKIDWLLIVTGRQGVGKSSMPAILFGGNSLTLYGDNSDKDLHMLLHSALVVGFDEMDSFSRKESSTLKAMITRSEDSFRPPYGASVETFPRRFTLYGCGDKAEFIQNDPAGYRRYPVIRAERKLDFAGLEAEREQLWAEAWAAYKSGSVAFWEVAGASERAEEFTIANPLDDQLINWVAAQCMNKSSGSIKNGVLYFNLPQMMIGVNREPDLRNPSIMRDVGNILASRGIRRGAGKAPVPGMIGRWYSVPTNFFD